MNEINGSSGTGPRELGGTPAGGTTRSQPATSQGGSGKPAAGHSDQVSLTDKASQLNALEKHIAELPVVDTQRVEQIQRAIAAGNFEIQPARIADKMLAFEAGLPDSNKA